MVFCRGCYGLLAAARLAARVVQAAEATASTACWKDTPCDSHFVRPAFPGPWEANILAPASRTVSPKWVVLEGQDGALGRTPLASASPLVLRGNGSQIVFDFGQEVGGLVTLRYVASRRGQGLSGETSPALGLAFTESSDFIGPWSDASNGAFQGPDGAIYADLGGVGDGAEATYTMPDASLRGGFRYLTVFLRTDANTTVATPLAVTLHTVALDLAFQPTWPSLRAYQGYFACDSPLLTRVWYAGAYTLQTNAVPPHTGRRVPFLKTGWANDGRLGPGDTILVDGAKRDRAVWPGDMGVAVPALLASTGDLVSVRNALQTLYDNQNADGSFPEAGPPLLQQGSDTYHLWTMIGTHTYVLYTNDTAFLARNWPAYRHAMAFITAKQDPATALLRVTGVRDWARLGVGGSMTEAQVILFRALVTGAELAGWVDPEGDPEGDPAEDAAAWTAAAARLRNATLALCYDPQAGLLRDSATPAANIYPQDANALAVALGMVDGGSPLAANISAHLMRNWVSVPSSAASSPPSFDPVAPELPGHVSPFIASWEVRAHLAAGATDRALDLVRALWGQALERPDSTGSTLVEGLYLPASGEPTLAYRWNRGYGGAHNLSAVAAPYTSHSHGWSAGPTSALTECVLGLSVTGRGGATWRFAPQFGRLRRAEGGFATVLGRFQATWQRAGAASYAASVDTPTDTAGELVLPVPGSADHGRSANTRHEQPSLHGLRVVLNGEAVDPGPDTARLRSGTAFTLRVPGGKHTIHVSQKQ